MSFDSDRIRTMGPGNLAVADRNAGVLDGGREIPRFADSARNDGLQSTLEGAGIKALRGARRASDPFADSRAWAESRTVGGGAAGIDECASGVGARIQARGSRCAAA
jgi:hypothetical protein